MISIENLQSNIRAIENIEETSTYICSLLTLYGVPKATIARLGISEDTPLDSGIAIGNKMLIVYTKAANLYAKFDSVQKNIIKNKAYRFILLLNDIDLLSLDTQTNEWLSVSRSNIHSEYEFFLPLAGIERSAVTERKNASIKVGEKFAQLYNELLMLNPGKDEAINALLINLVGSFFADSCDLLEMGSFHNWLEIYCKSDASNLDDILSNIFHLLSGNNNGIPEYMLEKCHRHINGLPPYPSVLSFNTSTRKLLISVSELNWEEVEPEVLGALIQSIVNPDETSVAYNYTSTANIYKVIGPLFMDDLYEQYESRKDAGDLDADLLKEINNIRVFDPACGTGNFLMVCYRELKKLEIQIKKYCNENRKPYTEKDYVTIEHFYGFESNPVATAISQMGLAFTAQKYNDTDTGDIVLPVNTICNGSALLLDWNTFCPKANVKVFIVGNPSYKGAHTLSAAQQHEVQSALSEEIANGFKAGELDYAAAYFYKATRYIAGTDGGFAFVTTNSLTQGIHVPTLWPMLFSHGISISFAHTSFKWKNEGRNTTAVTVVIIGCRSVNNPHDKTIYDGNLSYDADDISPYLTKGGVIVSKENRGPICSWMPKMIKGNMPYNTDYLLLGPDDRQTLIETYPTSSRFLRRAVGSEEFVKGKERWCLWIYDEDLQAAMDIPPIADRIEAVRMARLASKDKSVKRMASRAHQFREMNMPEKYSLVVPSVTSENRPYLQVGYLGTKYVVTNLAFVIYDANPWVFGLISSKMHNLWVRTICGGLETRIRYSNVLGYNTFPVPTLTDEQKKAISDAALGVIMEREYNSEMTLVELYNEDTMPAGLRYAHKLLDEIVERCYKIDGFYSDQERLDAMFVLYKELKGV